MACARVYDGFVGSKKRFKTELFLYKAGHRWPARPVQGPLSAADCIVNLWTSLDKRGDPSGDLSDLSDEDIELEAVWSGKPGLLVRALVSCGWIDVSEDGKSRRWHDYRAFNGKTFAVRKNGRGGGRPRDPNSRRSRQGAYGTDGAAKDDRSRNLSRNLNRNLAETNGDRNRNQNRNSPESGVPESEGGRGEDASPACPRPPPPGSPSASARTVGTQTLPPPVETTPGDPSDDGSDMAEPAPREAKPIETAAQRDRRLAKIAFERELTRNLRTALPHIVRRWNETIDELDKEFPLEEHPQRAKWVRYETFPKSAKIRSALRARAREAIESGRKFNDDFENALLGVKTMGIWTSYSPTWRPNLESFLVASKWETKVAAGKQLQGDAEREAEKERLETEAFDKQYAKIEAEANERRARNGQVTS